MLIIKNINSDILTKRKIFVQNLKNSKSFVWLFFISLTAVTKDKIFVFRKICTVRRIYIIYTVSWYGMYCTMVYTIFSGSLIFGTRTGVLCTVLSLPHPLTPPPYHGEPLVFSLLASTLFASSIVAVDACFYMVNLVTQLSHSTWGY